MVSQQTENPIAWAKWRPIILEQATHVLEKAHGEPDRGPAWVLALPLNGWRSLYRMCGGKDWDL